MGLILPLGMDFVVTIHLNQIIICVISPNIRAMWSLFLAINIEGNY